jgi:DNA (cytosine-5)-methyltransferase 1
MGYHRAGFDVVGVDINPQPHYPFPFILGDALEVLRRLIAGEAIQASDSKSYTLDDFAVIHASPPCQVHSTMTKRWGQDVVQGHVDLIPATRAILKATGKPYIIENVEGARSKLICPVMLCGTMFGLGSMGAQLRRHRYFECSFFVGLTPPCQHNKSSAIGVYGGGQHPRRRKTIGVYGHSGGRSKRDNYMAFGVDARREAMGIDWMTQDELSQAIPPVYTEWIGQKLLEVLPEWMKEKTKNG